MSVTLVHSTTKPTAAPKLKKRVVLFYPEFTKIAGSIDAALLLSQLAYWFQNGPKGKPRVRVRRNGRLTYVRSHEDMRADTGLSEWRLRKARERLEAAGLVQVEVHLFGNKTLPHWWLDLPRLDSEIALKTGPEAHTIPDLRAPSRSCIKLCGEEVGEGRNAPESARTKDPLDFDIDVVEEGIEEADMGLKYVGPEAAQGTSAADVAAKMAARRAPGAGGKLSAGALAGLWKRHEFERTGAFQKAWTAKEMGQAGKLTRALGERAWPVCQWALDNWAALTFEAKSVKGKGGAPSEPVLGWLLQYHDVAVRMWERASLPQTGRISYAQAATMDAKPPAPAVQPSAEAPASADEAKEALAAFTQKGTP